MKTRITLFAVVCCIGAAWGQTPSPAPKPDPEYKAYEVMMGDWQYEGQAQDSPFGPGGKFAGKQSNRWVLGGFFMEVRGQEQGNLGALEWREFDWYDAKAKNYSLQGYWNIGDTYSGTNTVSGNVWKFTGSQTHSGIPYKIRGESRFAADGMSVTWKNEISADGKTWKLLGEGKATKVVSPTAAVEQELKKLEEDWTQALVKRDLSVLDWVLAEEWTFTDPEGTVVTKAQYLAWFRSGECVVTSMVNDAVQVRIYGDMAVVTGLDTEKTQFKGKDISGQYRWTDTLIKRDGRWQSVATHGSKVARQ